MADSPILRGADSGSLGTLPTLTAADRGPLERLIWMAPDVAWSTAAAVIRSHQPDAHELISGRTGDRSDPEVARLARSLVYLGLAIAAPAQGKLLPTLTRESAQRARTQASQRFARWNAAGLVNRRGGVEEDGVPDEELRAVLEALVERAVARSHQDPTWFRGIIFSEASALYVALVAACREQFGATVDLDQVNAHLFHIAHASDWIANALEVDRKPLDFDPERQRVAIERLRRYGWQEYVASTGRSLADIAGAAAAAGYTSQTEFALSGEWCEAGASILTNGQRYFIRPGLLPDSINRALWSQEERLTPLQKMLAGAAEETGLRLGLPTMELLVEYASQHGPDTFLHNQWSRTINRFSGMHVRFGVVGPSRYSITLFPASRLDGAVGICPIIEVIRSAT